MHKRVLACFGFWKQAGARQELVDDIDGPMNLNLPAGPRFVGKLKLFWRVGKAYLVPSFASQKV